MRRVILCPKHQSTWETFFFASFTSHPLAYVFKKELLRIPVFGWCMGRLGMIHIDRTQRNLAWAKVAEQGEVLMDRGKWIIMFPEGTRGERGQKGNYKSGATRLAVSTGAYIVPIAVTSGRCWPRRSFSFIPGMIDVSIGQPVSAEGREPGELMDEVERWIEAEMHRLDPEAYLTNV
jgi:1-acyl-sn-glycerol-3-phosphate acyltransferase